MRAIARRWSIAALAWAPIACAAPPPPAPPSAPLAAPPPATAAPTAAVDPPPPLGLDGTPMAIDSSDPHRTAAALCADHVARAARALAESGGFPHLRPKRPSCRETKLPVPFRGDATFRGARAFVLDSGLSVETHLAVELSGGLVLTPIAWEYHDIHSSDAVPLPATLESLTTEKGSLIAVVGRTEGTKARDRDAVELALVRGVAVCRAGADLTCRAYFPEAPAPMLGSKRRPWESSTPWSDLPWDRTPSFTFDPSGRLILGP